MHEERSNTYFLGCIYHAAGGILEESAAEATPLVRTRDGQPSKDCNGNRVRHIAADAPCRRHCRDGV